MSGIIFPDKWNNCSSASLNILPQTPHDAQSSNTFELEEKIRDSINLAVEKLTSLDTANTTIGLALSGGLDSSILATILHQLKVPFQAITIANNPNHPDIVHAQILAEQLGFPHKIVIIQTADTKDTYWHLFNTFILEGINKVVCGDAIDEILGGYYTHNESLQDGSFSKCFQQHWQDLGPKHLDPLNAHAKKHGISVALPYLNLIEYLSKVPLNQRVYRLERKVLLLELGHRLNLPLPILKRKKMGLCSALR